MKPDLSLVVIHDAGDPQGGSRWAPVARGWPGPALAPDLPGHGSAPPPTGGSYAPADAALVVLQALGGAGLSAPVGVAAGHGWGGFAAELLAAGGRAGALVLVDALGGPWRQLEEIVDEQHRWLRAVFDDPDAIAPTTTSPDPRVGHRFPSLWERGFTEARRSSITVPVLALESPVSTTPPEERDDRLAAFAGPATWQPITDAAAAPVLDAIMEWWPPAV